MKKYVVNTDVNPQVLGDSHRYETKKGIISMIHPCYATYNKYEIYSIEGNLFEDVERYPTIEEAEERIINLIGDDFKFGR